jgi:hypothetical protein
MNWLDISLKGGRRMSRKPFALSMFHAMLGISACRDATTKMSGPQAAPPLGYLEHRNHQYPIRDLMDPTYRAANSDKFVRGFNPQTALANDGKGISILQAVDFEPTSSR